MFKVFLIFQCTNCLFFPQRIQNFRSIQNCNIQKNLSEEGLISVFHCRNVILSYINTQEPVLHSMSESQVHIYSVVINCVNFQDMLMNEMKSLWNIQFVLVVTRIFSNPSGFLCRNVKLQLKSQILSFLRKCYFPLPSVWTGLFVATRTSRFRLFIYFRLLDGI